VLYKLIYSKTPNRPSILSPVLIGAVYLTRNYDYFELYIKKAKKNNL